MIGFLKRKIMKIRRLIVLVFTALTFFGSTLEALPRQNASEYKNSTPKTLIEGMPNEPLDLGFDQKFCRAFYEKNEKIDIYFTVRITMLRNRYTNIFQTDDLNMGLRLEIGPDGELNAFVRSPDGYGPEKVIGVLSYGFIKANSVTKIHISVHSNTLSVNIGDGPDKVQKGNFQPSCNRVLIGGGYDGTRTTIGDVRAIVGIQNSDQVTTFGLPIRVRDITRILFLLLLFALACDNRKNLFVRS